MSTVSLSEFPDRYKLVQTLGKASGHNCQTDEIDDFHLLSNNLNSNCRIEIYISPVFMLQTIQRPVIWLVQLMRPTV